MSTAVRLISVSKSFRGASGATPAPTWAARDVSLSIDAGETVGIIGPNGAGKTTMLRMIGGITQPDSGRIERLRRTVALVDLGAGFHPDLTGDENIDFGGALLGMRQRDVDARRQSIRAFAGLGDGLHKPVRHFSTGMVARLAFALAVHSDPSLLLVDEVLAVGDAEFQAACIAKLAALRDAGVTLLLVSHELALIATLCDRVLLLESGRVTGDGRPAEVIASYLGAPLDHSGPTATLSLEVVATRPEPREITIRVTLHATRRHPDASARIEIGLPVHPAANVVDGLDGPLIFAADEIDGPWSEIGEHNLDYRVAAAGLPPGRFIARVVLDAGSEQMGVASDEFVVPGAPPPTPEVVLDAVAGVTPAGDRTTGS